MSEEKKCPNGKTFVERTGTKKEGSKKSTIWNNTVQFCASNKQVVKKGYVPVEEKQARIPSVEIIASQSTKQDIMTEFKQTGKKDKESMILFLAKYKIDVPQAQIEKNWKRVRDSIEKKLTKEVNE